METNNGVLYERHIRDLEGGREFLFVYGVVNYRDVYKKATIPALASSVAFRIKALLDRMGRTLAHHISERTAREHTTRQASRNIATSALNQIRTLPGSAIH